MKQIVVAEAAEAQTLLQNLREKKITFEAAEQKFSKLSPRGTNDDVPFYDIQSNPLVAQLLNSPVGLQNRIFQSPAGFHIVHVLQVKKGAPQSFAALRSQIEVYYKQKRSEELYLQWLKDHVKTDSVSVDHARLLALKAEYQESF